MSVFINSKKKYKAKNPETNGTFVIERDYIGNVPEWVSKTAIFNLAVQDGSIVIPKGLSDNAAIETKPARKTKG